MISEAVLIALVTGAFGVFGNWILNNKNTVIIQEKVDQLEKKVDKHNNLIERMYKLEGDVDVAFERIKENKEDIEELAKR